MHFLSRHGCYEAEMIEEENPDIVMHEALNEEGRDEAEFRLENFRRYGDLERASSYFDEYYGIDLSFPDHNLEKPVYNFSEGEIEDLVNYLDEKSSETGVEAEVDRMKFFLDGKSRKAPLSFGLRAYDRFMYELQVLLLDRKYEGFRDLIGRVLLQEMLTLEKDLIRWGSLFSKKQKRTLW